MKQPTKQKQTLIGSRFWQNKRDKNQQLVIPTRIHGAFVVTGEEPASWKRWSGIPQNNLCSHLHFINVVVLSSDGIYVLPGSWTWPSSCRNRHQQIDPPHRRPSCQLPSPWTIVRSGSCIKPIMLRNTLAECKCAILEESLRLGFVLAFIRTWRRECPRKPVENLCSYPLEIRDYQLFILW